MQNSIYIAECYAVMIGGFFLYVALMRCWLNIRCRLITSVLVLLQHSLSLMTLLSVNLYWDCYSCRETTVGPSDAYAAGFSLDESMSMVVAFPLLCLTGDSLSLFEDVGDWAARRFCFCAFCFVFLCTTMVKPASMGRLGNAVVTSMVAIAASVSLSWVKPVCASSCFDVGVVVFDVRGDPFLGEPDLGVFGGVLGGVLGGLLSLLLLALLAGGICS